MHEKTPTAGSGSSLRAILLTAWSVSKPGARPWAFFCIYIQFAIRYRYAMPILRQIVLSVCLVFALSGYAADYGSATVSSVTSIYDGDTFRANIAGWPPIVGKRVPIRLRGADTPEMRGKCRAEKVKAREAKQFTVAKLRNAESIQLTHIDRGKYFRIVAEVLVDGRDLAEMLISAGLARPYKGGHRQGWCAE